MAPGRLPTHSCRSWAFPEVRTLFRTRPRSTRSYLRRARFYVAHRQQDRTPVSRRRILLLLLSISKSTTLGLFPPERCCSLDSRITGHHSRSRSLSALSDNSGRVGPSPPATFMSTPLIC